METVAVVGVGLIGGSFALALRKAGFAGRILGVSSAPALRSALERGVIDEGLPLEQAVPRADLVYLAQPIRRILETLPALDSLLRPGVLVTDAGSTKRRIVEAGRASIRRAQFLGGHPMAGKEKRGVEQAAPDLFAGRPYVLTPVTPGEMETPAARDFTEWLSRIGAVLVRLTPEEHDRLVALSSHLPQLASTALAALLAGEGGLAKVAGPGLLDMTRLAMSAYDIWGDILHTNAEEIDAALAAYITRLEQIRSRLPAGELASDFETAASFARNLRPSGMKLRRPK